MSLRLQHPKTRRACIGLMGAAPDTGNRGVSALGEAVVQHLVDRCAAGRIWVADNHASSLPRLIKRHDDGTTLEAISARAGRNVLRRCNLYRGIWLNRLGLSTSPFIRAIDESDLVLDISGGDSFTSLYGPDVWRAQVARKNLVLRRKRSLVLLPQTYGPFHTEAHRGAAREVVRHAKMAWARDERSFALLQELLGAEFDSSKHRCGVDVAFALPAEDPGTHIQPELRALLLSEERNTIGLNVSGLIFNDSVVARDRYGFVADYRRLIGDLVRQLLKRTDATIVLIPHVIAVGGGNDSDPIACEAVRASTPESLRDRVQVLGQSLTASQTKWVIGRCGWFCGTRMHSCIAGLSSSVPTVAIAYSPKTQGVFEGCNVGRAVVDPRELDTESCIEQLLRLYDERETLTRALERSMPTVINRAVHQLDQALGLTARDSQPVEETSLGTPIPVRRAA